MSPEQLDAIDGRLHRWRGGWWEADESADGDVFQSAVADLGACVARIRADAERIAALTAERDEAVRFRDAYKRAKAENDERFMIERDAALARVRELEAAAQTVADATRTEERERCVRACDRERSNWDVEFHRPIDGCVWEIRNGREP